MGRTDDAEREAPFNYRILFALLLAIGLPLTVVVRAFWIEHTWGAIGVGFTVGYAVVLALLWTGRAPREPAAAKPSVITPEAWIYFRHLSGSVARLTVVNAQDSPLRVPGLGEGAAAGVEVEVLQGDAVVRRTTLPAPTPPPVLEVPATRYDFVSATFQPERSPSGRTVAVDLGPALQGLAAGRYDVRVRWDATPLAGEGLWVPPTPVVLGLFPVTLR